MSLPQGKTNFGLDLGAVMFLPQRKTNFVVDLSTVMSLPQGKTNFTVYLGAVVSLPQGKTNSGMDLGAVASSENQFQCGSRHSCIPLLRENQFRTGFSHSSFNHAQWPPNFLSRRTMVRPGADRHGELLCGTIDMPPKMGFMLQPIATKGKSNSGLDPPTLQGTQWQAKSRLDLYAMADNPHQRAESGLNPPTL
jgi:hypothetical protein